jgi:DNA-binding IclR family transcriptional regulator
MDREEASHRAGDGSLQLIHRGDLHAPITAISRSLAVLARLAQAADGLSVTDLHRMLDIEKSTVSRILTTLTAEGYTRRDGLTDRYHLTFRLPAMVYAYFSAVNFPQRCVPMLRELASETGELVELSVVDGDNLWYIAKVEGWRRVRLTPASRGPVELHATATGKAWLATLPQLEVVRILSTRRLGALAPGTITSVERYLDELENVRAAGYATCWDEFVEDCCSVAVAVPSPVDHRTAVGALTLAAPTFRFTREDMARLAPRLHEIAHAVSATWPLSHLPGEAGGNLVEFD